VTLLARSPRGANDIGMLRKDAEYYRIESSITSANRACEVAVAYQNGGRKRLTIDGVTVRAADFFERFAAVAAAPDDINLPAGPPSGRREFIDIYLSQVSAQYITELIRYRKALAQKNALLKQDTKIHENPYDQLLIQYGSSIMLRRNNFLEIISATAAEHYRRISGGHELVMKYKPAAGDPEKWEKASVEDAFEHKLRQTRSREEAMQVALVGPHRDDVDLSIGGLPARNHASQGELRTAAIALKLAVFDYLKQSRRMTPVLLLDEVFAELDAGRRKILIELFGRFGQLFLTTASEVPKPLADGARLFTLEKGAVFQE